MSKRKLKPIHRRTANKKKRNDALCTRYRKLAANKTTTGKSVLSFDAILDKLEIEFFLSRDYISRILSNND
jgi:hypothetical protein